MDIAAIAQAITDLIKDAVKEGQGHSPEANTHPMNLPPGVDPGSPQAWDYMMSTMSRLLTEKKQLENKIEFLVEDSQKWEMRINAVEDQRRALEGEIAEANFTIVNKSGRIQALEQEISRGSGEVSGYMGALAQRDGRIQELEKEAAELRKGIYDAVYTLTGRCLLLETWDTRNLIERLKEVADTREAVCKRERTRIQELENGKRTDQACLAEFLKAIKNLHALAQPKEGAGQVWEENHMELNIGHIADHIQKIEPLKAQVLDLSRVITIREMRIQELENKVDALKNQVKDQTAIIAQKEMKNDGAAELLDKYHEMERKKDDELHQKDQEINHLNQELNRHRTMAAAMHKLSTGAKSTKGDSSDPGLTPEDGRRLFPLVFGRVAFDAHQNAVEKGWWDLKVETVERMATFLCNVHGEVAEAWEALRNHNPQSAAIPGFTCIEEELADIIIRIMDTSVHENMRVPEALISKMAYNKDRPHRHGGKLA